MYQAPPDFETVFKTSKRHECLEARLVLDAAGIATDAGYQNGWWLLAVNRSDLAAAAAELEAYRQENPPRASHTGTTTPVYGGALTGVGVYAGVLLIIAGLTAQETPGLDWFAAGRMQAGRVMAGEMWRVVTALTLHLDVGHLVSNLIMGAVFGLLAGRVLGGGVAWLTIVVAGALGNLVNAAVQPSAHTSVGASTAVFAALGVIVSHALRPATPVSEKPLRRWSPLIAGVLLLAFTGVGGERTDVVAHVTGFVAGLLIGWAGCRLPHAWLAQGKVQAMAGATAVAIVVAAWIVAVVAGLPIGALPNGPAGQP